MIRRHGYNHNYNKPPTERTNMSVSNTSYMNGRDENGWENFLWRSTKKILPDAKQKKVLYLISYIIDRVLYMVYKIIVQWLTRVGYKSNCKRFMLLWMSLLLRQKPVRWCFALLLFRWLVRSVRLIQCSIDLISSISWFDLWLFCFGDWFDRFVWYSVVSIWSVRSVDLICGCFVSVIGSISSSDVWYSLVLIWSVLSVDLIGSISVNSREIR